MINKLNRADRIILIIAISLLVSFSYFLYDDSVLFHKTTLVDSEQIGRIYGLQNDVRRKSQGTYSWLPSSNLETVYHLDSVFTGSGSEASIQLLDGSLIHLRENSLITLNVVQGQLKLELKYGDIVGELKKDSEIKIKSGSEEFELKGDNQDSSVIISRDRVGKSDVQSLRGKIQIKSAKSGQKSILKNATAEKIAAVEKPRALTNVMPPLPKLNTQIQYITPNRTIFTRHKLDQAMTLNWKTTGDYNEMAIEVRHQPTDSEILYQFKTKSDQLTLPTSFNEGEYAWRLVALDREQKPIVKADHQVFSVHDIIAPYITKPQLGEALPSEIPQIQLEWSGQNSALYEWQIATDKEFKKLVNSGTVAQSQSDISTPKPDDYWIRVRAQKTNKPNLDVYWTEWSESSKFKVLPAQLVSIPAPRLNQKKYSVHPKAADDRGPASIPATRVTWKEVKTANTYMIEVSSDQNFSKSEKIETKAPEFVLEKYSQKTQYVRVTAKAKSGAVSPPSDLGEISLFIDKPILSKIDTQVEKAFQIGAQPKGLEVPFKWSRVYAASQYRLELSKTAKFENVETIDISENEKKLILKEPGKYFARVRPTDKTGAFLTAFSEPIQFEYLFRTALPKPDLSEPSNKSTVFLQKDVVPFVWLEWKVAPTAKKYEIQISTDSEFKTIVMNSSSEKTRFLVKQKIPYGNVYWRVRALAEDPLHNSDWSEPRVFSLTFKKNENFIE